MKAIWDYILGTLGGIFVMLLCSAVGVEAIATHLLFPLMKRFYLLVKDKPEIVQFVDAVLQKLSDYWPPKE